MKSLRVVLHAHSTWSYDGSWELSRIARLYGALGVDVVMMTEHDTGFDPAQFAEYRAACVSASTRSCILVPGIEYSSPDNDIHILTWGLADFLAEHRPVAETLAEVQARGGVAIFAHPIRREAWRLFDPVWVPQLAGIELWNRKSDGLAPSREAWDLIQQTGLPPTVGQDFHRFRQLYPLTMRAEISGPLEEGLVAALASGRMTPLAFRRPLIGSDGMPCRAVHDRAEGARQVLRDLVRGKRGKVEQSRT